MKLSKPATNRLYAFCHTLTGKKIHIFKDENPRTSYFLYPLCSKKKVSYNIGGDIPADRDGEVCEHCLAIATRRNMLAKES